ncbi:MAG: ABC transporter ATP-binding protein [archaeon]
MQIVVDKVKKEYVNGHGSTLALNGVSFEVKKGEFFCILGPSGCGKTTLLNLLAGFDNPSAGTIHIDGKVVLKPHKEYVTVFQEHSLFPWLNSFENVSFGLELNGKDKAECVTVAAKCLKQVHLEDCEKLFPCELSGGMKQRLQLARTLAVKPKIIFMDEPFAALDPLMKEELQNEILRIWREEKLTIVLVTHDISSAIMLADRIAVMSKSGTIKEIIEIKLARPRDKLTMQIGKLEKQIYEVMASK